MSRCGSCPMYWKHGNYGVTCKGNLGVEGCADKFLSLYYAMQEYITELTAGRPISAKEPTKEQSEAAPSTQDLLTKIVNQNEMILDKLAIPPDSEEAPAVDRAPDGYPNKLKMVGDFEFIGQDESMGLCQGQVYHLVVKRRGVREYVWAYWFDNKRKECPYTNMMAFFKNWRRVDWIPSNRNQRV